jgi:hypothetical protein
MAARPPPDDLDDPDPTEFGIVALDAHLDGADLQFPATAREVLDALGDPSVVYGPSGATVELSAVLDRLDRERFDSRQELLDATHPEFERLRQRGGPLSWLRSLFT